MDWSFTSSVSGSAPLRPPADGIVVTSRPKGGLALRWTAMFQDLPEENASRMARGRTFARSGRVRGLWFIPGAARAEVFDTSVHDARIHIRTFERREWGVLIDVLLNNLEYIAALIEGDLPSAFVDALDALNLSLVPTREELRVDCDCADYVMPCAHVSALHHVLADALDGDPFLLLTLRGRAQDQILNTLRESWGDDEPLRSVSMQAEEAPPGGNWFLPHQPINDLKFSFTNETVLAAGLRALGPPPGDVDLEHALKPLYAAGAEAALNIAHTDATIPDRRRRRRPLPGETFPTAPQAPTDPSTLTEAIVNTLADMENASSKVLADVIGAHLLDVRSELLELEKLGLVYRTGQTRGTRWWLG